MKQENILKQKMVHLNVCLKVLFFVLLRMVKFIHISFQFNRYNNLNNSIMKNRQLMRLNLVSHKGQVKTIDCIAPGQVILLEDRTTEESFGGWVDLDEIEFIELTEEWLLKFGFRFDSIDWEFPNESIFFIGYYSSKFCLGSGSDGVTKENYIHYVHQLQNLYFALTGQELTIKN